VSVAVFESKLADFLKSGKDWEKAARASIRAFWSRWRDPVPSDSEEFQQSK